VGGGIQTGVEMKRLTRGGRRVSKNGGYKRWDEMHTYACMSAGERLTDDKMNGRKEATLSSEKDNLA
jgi:hypothetical protein